MLCNNLELVADIVISSTQIIRITHPVEVLNSVLFTNDCLCKIGYVSNPNCTFCSQLTETISHILFSCSFSNSFGCEVNEKILSKIKSCRGLSLTYCDIIVGSFEEEMDLFNYIVILGKSFLWTCRCRETLPSLSHFIRILVIKYETEKHSSNQIK